MTDNQQPQLLAQSVTLGYGAQTVTCRDLTLAIRPGSFTVIVGPNACGKSTLLRAMARLLVPSQGQVVLDGLDINRLKTRDVARRLGLLPQTSSAPEGISVAELVARGRYPHQSFLRQWSAADEEAVHSAVAATDIADFSDRPVDTLSGGQRQRAWVAMALAQETPILLLDEPTTFLDIAHQIDLMDLLERLNREGRTIVAVLHDLNQAARYASHLVAMKNGKIVAEGHPRDVVTQDMVKTIFDIACIVIDDPVTGLPLVVPMRGNNPTRDLSSQGS
ncbi:MAG: ABC transporter ATP-binding protein [Shinella sp.]|nr:ABC transporter ATP-binding protein [Shinella sp.]